MLLFVNTNLFSSTLNPCSWRGWTTNKSFTSGWRTSSRLPCSSKKRTSSSWIRHGYSPRLVTIPVNQISDFVPVRSSDVLSTIKSLRWLSKLRPPTPFSSGTSQEITTIVVTITTKTGTPKSSSCRNNACRTCFERQNGQTFAATLIVSAQNGQTLVCSFSAITSSSRLLPRLQHGGFKAGGGRRFFRQQIPKRQI